MNEEKIVELISLEHRRQALKLELEAIERDEEEIKTALLQEMEESKMDVFETDEIRIKYVAPIIRETLDTSKLKKEYPDIAHACIKQNEIKANWKITLKGE